MPRIDTVYLAGPHRFHPQAARLTAAQDALCAAAGVLPLRSAAADPDVSGTENGELRARMIYSETAARLRLADAVVADLSPWRGPGPDAGSAFEAGFAAALGKPVCAYANLQDEDEAELLERVRAHLGGAPDADGAWRDGEGALIEDLGLPETAMLWAEARRFYVIVTPDPFEELAGLELCLEALKLYAD